MHLILASQSPRRRQLLSDLGLPLSFVDITTDETIDEATPIHLMAETIARRKASAYDSTLLDTDQTLITADTDDHDTAAVHDIFPPSIALKAHICVQTPQPTHCAASMTAFPSRMEMAGQPIRMQLLHPRQDSVRMDSGGFLFTPFRRAQGRLEMMTDGSSISSASRTAASVSLRS